MPIMATLVELQIAQFICEHRFQRTKLAQERGMQSGIYQDFQELHLSKLMQHGTICLGTRAYLNHSVLYSTQIPQSHSVSNSFVLITCKPGKQYLKQAPGNRHALSCFKTSYYNLHFHVHIWQKLLQSIWKINIIWDFN